jgi:hypothetical protein
VFDEKKKALNLLHNGLIENINPHKSFVTLSKYYKYMNLSKERTSDLLIDWLKKQKCNIEFSEVVTDLDRVVNDVYRKNYRFLSDINIKLYQNEIDFINDLKYKGERSVALSLLYLSKIFGNKFYCYHLTLHKLTKLSIRHIKRLIKKLNKCGFIDILNQNETKKVIERDEKLVKRYSHPNTYRINILGEGNIVLSCGDIDSIYELIELLK